MKLNGATVKGFFLNHGEKLVFAAVATVLVGGAYSLVAHETYQKEPDSLVKNSDAAIKYVHSSTWDPVREQVVVVDPNKLVDTGNVKLPPDDWRMRNPWYRIGGGIGRARPAPQVLAALELEVDAGFGPIAFSPEDKKGRRNEGQQAGAGRGDMPAGAAAPAAPPGGKQKKDPPKKPVANKKADPKPAPVKVAAQGHNLTKKFPGVQVSAETKIQGKHWVSLRAVVPGKSQAAEYASAFQGARWTDDKEDQVRYTGFKVQRATISADDPNAPAKWEDLDMKACDKFEQQFPQFAQEVVAPAFLDENLTKPLPPLLAREWGREAAHARFPVLKQEEEAAPPQDDDDNEDPDAPDDPQPAKQPIGPARMPGASGGKVHATGHEPNDDFLFRFFDFTVDPQVRYRYRIALVLHNPNQNVPERHLEKPDLKADSTLITDWSQPSAVVEIPGERHWLVGPAKAGQSTVEPSVQTMVVLLDKKRGIEVTYEAKTVRGQAIDFPKIEVSLINPKTGQSEKDIFDFLTGAVLVDFKGGTMMPAPGRAKREAEPSDALYLTEDGRLVSHAELLEEIRYGEFLSAQKEAGADDKDDKPGKAGKSDGNAVTPSPFDLMPSAPGPKKKK